jgi:hypothetical protein
MYNTFKIVQGYQTTKVEKFIEKVHLEVQEEDGRTALKSILRDRFRVLCNVKPA